MSIYMFQVNEVETFLNFTLASQSPPTLLQLRIICKFHEVNNLTDEICLVVIYLDLKQLFFL